MEDEVDAIATAISYVVSGDGLVGHLATRISLAQFLLCNLADLVDEPRVLGISPDNEVKRYAVAFRPLG